MDLEAGVALTEPIDPSCWIPVFPLPSAVLLPRSILPLHVFEQRYRAMTRDALADNRLMAVALLKPCSAESYFTLEAPVHPVLGVGRIMREERLPDGRYNFLLQGIVRAQIVAEDTSRCYRRARVLTMKPADVDPQIECDIRHRLRRLLTRSSVAPVEGSDKLRHLLECSDLSLSDVIDVLASVVLQGAEEKQAFLETHCLARRAKAVFAAFTELETAVDHQCAVVGRTRKWPPPDCRN
jgi:Lon protease-like protein